MVLSDIYNDVIDNVNSVCFKLNLNNDVDVISELIGMKVENIQNCLKEILWFMVILRRMNRLKGVVA